MQTGGHHHQHVGPPKVEGTTSPRQYRREWITNPTGQDGISARAIQVTNTATTEPASVPSPLATVAQTNSTFTTTSSPLQQQQEGPALLVVNPRATSGSNSNTKISAPVITLAVLYILTLTSFVISAAVLAYVMSHQKEPPPREQAPYSSVNILPDLTGQYLSHFMISKYDAETNMIVEDDLQDNRPVSVSRDTNSYHQFISYVFNNNGVADMGAIHPPDFVDEPSTAVFMAGTRIPTWEQWTIHEDGTFIDSVLLSADDDGQPICYLGVYEKSIKNI